MKYIDQKCVILQEVIHLKTASVSNPEVGQKLVIVSYREPETKTLNQDQSLGYNKNIL